MIGLVFKIHNSLNYDIGFPYLEGNDPIAGAASHRLGIYANYDKLSQEVGPPEKLKLYKVRLSGLVKNKKETPSISDGFIKHCLIQWNNRVGGVFYVLIKSLDKYGRIEADLMDPVCGELLSNWLLKEFPENYRPYRNEY